MAEMLWKESPGSQWDVLLGATAESGSLQLAHHGPVAGPAVFSVRLAHEVGDKMNSGDLVGKRF